ncbi:hypothetical protein QM565_29475 [Geitlerinema splendidum]|nr:hypothetical protein [Geitlerinema splendidum]
MGISNRCHDAIALLPQHQPSCVPGASSSAWRSRGQTTAPYGAEPLSGPHHRVDVNASRQVRLS